MPHKQSIEGGLRLALAKSAPGRQIIPRVTSASSRSCWPLSNCQTHWQQGYRCLLRSNREKWDPCDDSWYHCLFLDDISPNDILLVLANTEFYTLWESSEITDLQQCRIPRQWGNMAYWGDELDINFHKLGQKSSDKVV